MPTDTKEKRLTQEELNMFTGSEEFYKHWLGGIYTQGVLHMADAGGAHWLIDAVYSYQGESHVKHVPFQLWELKRTDQETPEEGKPMAILTMKEDTNEPELVRQEIEYTDFPLKYVKLYLIDKTLLLPSEY